MRLLARAPAKVNLCLFVGRLRADGRHEVVTLLESVSLADELKLTTLEHGGPDQVSCPGVQGPNLVSAALEGLRAQGWDAPPVRIEVCKRIPVAAGMGGGSVDAAAALRLADRLAPVPRRAIWELAARLGADVPSQLTPGVALGTGAGDRVSPLPALAPHAFVIVPQSHQLATPAVYAEADRFGLPRPLDELARLRDRLHAALAGGAPPADELLVNDLEPAAVSLCPEIASALREVRAAGAEHALVCGSGPTVIGLLWGPDARERAEAAASALSKRFPYASSAIPAAGGFGDPRHPAQFVA